MTDVRALTLHQPWASLVAVGAKRIETRSWSTRYRGRILIHAGKVFDESTYPHLTRHLFTDTPGEWKVPSVPPVPRMAVVALAVLADVVPMVNRWGVPTQHAFASPSGVLTIGRDGELLLITPGDSPVWRDVSAELPFGDFRPGRYAWLLEDVQPTTARCPRCWGTGEVLGLDMPELGCKVCRSTGECEPVPMRGRQGLWVPTWVTS